MSPRIEWSIWLAAVIKDPTYWGKHRPGLLPPWKLCTTIIIVYNCEILFCFSWYFLKNNYHHCTCITFVYSKVNKAEPVLALKPRNPKQGYQWPTNRTHVCVRQKKHWRKWFPDNIHLRQVRIRLPMLSLKPIAYHQKFQDRGTCDPSKELLYDSWFPYITFRFKDFFYFKPVAILIETLSSFFFWSTFQTFLCVRKFGLLKLPSPSQEIWISCYKYQSS